MTTEQPLTQFDYLLNAYTNAAQSDKPADNGYREKRLALYAYVRDLERIASRAQEPKPVDEALTLEQIDAAFETEIARVSHVHYDSNEICRHFFGELRKRLAALSRKEQE